MEGSSVRVILGLMLAGVLVGSNASNSAEAPEWVIEEADQFAYFDSTVSIVHPQINCSHTHYYEVHGVCDTSGTDRESVVFVGGSEFAPEVVGYVRLCPRYDDPSDINNYPDSMMVVAIAEDWMSAHGFTPPAGFYRQAPVLRQVGVELMWEIFWTHNFSAVSDTDRVVPDFILVEVDAEEGEVISYSKAHHSIDVDTVPDIPYWQALSFARDHLDSLGYDPLLPRLSMELGVVYPNDYFTQQKWEWSDVQHLCWIVQFGDSLDPSVAAEPAVDIWVEANGTGGELLGGQVYETPEAELYGIPNQQNDTDIQKGYLERMQYDLTNKIHKGNTTDDNITNSISDPDNFLFILHTHGYVEDNKEHAIINNSASGDAQVFSSDEVPDHTLHYALMSCCHSGDDQGDVDFEDEFVDHYTGDSYFCFQGYEGSVDPDDYEDREFYHLSMGHRILNAHVLAKAETQFKATVVFTFAGAVMSFWGTSLVPLYVDVSEEPEEPHAWCSTFWIHVDVKNREWDGETQATGVNVELDIPPGFEILAGDNPQDLGSIDYGCSKRATWHLQVATFDEGTVTFDAKVWSDNLGVALDDPGESYYHKEDVTVTGWGLPYGFKRAILPVEQGLYGIEGTDTTWIGWSPTGDPKNYMIGSPGRWDFDDLGNHPCPVEDGYQEYIKNGAYAQWWTSESIYQNGDFAAVRDRYSFINNDVCGFDDCDMEDCVLALYDPSVPGQYGNGGHRAGCLDERVWSPAIDLTSYAPRGYCIAYDLYADLPIVNWVFYRHFVSYVQDPGCPTGEWSQPVSDDYVYYVPQPSCRQVVWGFSQYVPTDADSVRIGLSAWNGCTVWEVPCTNGNESPIFDNVRLGIWDLSAPQAGIRAIDNYTDAFPENDTLSVTATALIDAAHNKSLTGAFLRLADSAFIALDAPDVYAEICFRVVPGPGTDLGDPFFTTKYPDAWAPCDTSSTHCTRMDTAFAAGDGDTTSQYEYQTTFDGYFATMIHEDDPLYAGEGEEILPDSLFTPGTKIFYAFRTSFLPGPGPYSWLPFGADMDDVSTLYEVTVLPDYCKDPLACLLYVDYYNRGAQIPIENALTLLGRTWDRFDLRGESSQQGNGIGNRLLGPGKYRLARGPIGPSLDHLAQYKVMLINNGDFGAGVTFSDGGTGTPDDPSNDIGFLDLWINEGSWKGLWLSGNGIAADYATSVSGPKAGFLSNTMGVSLVASSYRDWSGHPVGQAYSCRTLCSSRGLCRSQNYFDDGSSTAYRLLGSGCPQTYDYDVIAASGAGGIVGHALIYDNTDVGLPPGGYASVYHVFPAANAPFDTVRTILDGFSLHNLRDWSPECTGALSIARWARRVLGGHDWVSGQPWPPKGYMFDRQSEFQYCPPEFAEADTVLAGTDGGPVETFANALFQNCPNPFRSASGTTIRYSVAKAGVVEVHVFDVAGRLVNTIVDQARPGDNFLIWDGRTKDGRRVASGVYFYQLKAGDFKGQKKMLLVE